MPKNLQSNSKWSLVTIDDSQFLEGKSILDILKLCTTTNQFNYVITNDISGSGKIDWLIYNLQKKKNRVFKIQKMLNILTQVKNFEWGDFFLFKEYPSHWSNPQGKAYPFLIAQTDTTIRAIDNQYIYIYTPNENLVKVIVESYSIESMSTDFLDNLAYPY